jgi:Rieske Fe-S protein
VSDRELSRRALLGLGAAAPVAALAACRPAPPPPPPGTTVALASLPEGEPVVVMNGEEPVELLRDGDSVRALSLWCTHAGCRVRWVPGLDAYQCYCHDGRFAKDGSVLLGPPVKPLRRPAIEIRGDSVWIPPPPAALPPAGPA